MKILHVFDHSIPLHSGYTFRSRAILDHQHKLGWVTEHVTSPKHNIAAHPDNEEEIVDGLHFFRTKPKSGFFAKLPILNQMAIISALEKRLDEIIPIIKPDIIHAHSPALNGRAAVNMGNKYKIPVVYEIRAFWEDAAVDHGTTHQGSYRYRLTRSMETRVVKEASAVTTICAGLKNDLIDRGIPPEKITIIPNAVDITKFSVGRLPDNDLSQQLGLKGKVVIGFIGSFYAYEGLPLLVQAIEQLNEDRLDVALLLVGGGPQEKMLKTMVSERGLGQQVIFTGRVPHNDVQRYYDMVDIFVYPRLSMRLTNLVTPLKPLEAMAMGHIVLASDVGGHKELIVDGDNGMLFPAGDADALAGKITDLINDRNCWDGFRNSGRKYVEEVRNWKNSVSNYSQIYKKLTEERG